MNMLAPLPAATEPAPIGAPSEEINLAANDSNALMEISASEEITISWPDYTQFLESKIKLAGLDGIDIDPREVSGVLKPHQRDIVVWALRGGRRAVFAAFGLGKTLIQIEIMRLLLRHVDGPCLIVLPLGVRQEFMRDAKMLGVAFRFIRADAEIDPAHRFYLSNYESVRDGKLHPEKFVAASLDEASVLRSYGSKTYQEFLPLFAAVEYRFVATATPAPNRYKEMIHYAGFLGVMDTGQALTRFFQRNSEQAGDLTLYPHKEDEFWLWVHSWAIFVQKPSDLGHSDDGYELPPLTVTWHEVPTDHAGADFDRDGQGVLLRSTALGLSDAAREKRESLPARIEKLSDLIQDDPKSHYLIWHDLEAERHAIEEVLPEAVTVYGTQDLDKREQLIIAFSDGAFPYLATKPEMYGSGANFQRHCHKAIYLGVGYKFNDFIQSIHRIYRFLQTEACEIHIIHSEAERDVVAVLKDKWARHDEMVTRMRAIIKQYGLDKLPTRDVLARSIGLKRVEVRGERYVLANNDAVDEVKRWGDNSIDEIVSSIPFGTQYEYAESYNDFGHNGDVPGDTSGFWSQMDFLTPQLLRMLKPGRRMCIHVKDRILFGAVTGKGAPTVAPFHAEALMHYRAHGFDYMGMITVITDVVRENAQTYRLGWSENAKDSTKMGCGMPEYVLLLRKPQSDRSRGYADDPVAKDKAAYTRARWQVDAHGFWRSSGNRLMTAEELAGYGPAELAKRFTQGSLQEIYDYEFHVRIGEELERMDRLPTKFMCIAPGSWHPDVWHDVLRMRTLNSNQAARRVEKHLCLAAGSLVLTRDGYKAIEDVNLGDQVLTHKGRWRPVIAKQNTGARPVVTVKAHGVSGLTLTPDHQLWTRKVRGLPWSIDHSKKEAARTEPGWVRADETFGSYINLKLPPTEYPSIESVRYWWTIGRWLADGHFSPKARSYVISCGYHEVEFLRRQLGEYDGKKPYDVGTGVQIILRNPKKSLLKATLEKCGRGASGKHLPAEAFTLPAVQARALLDGYLSGDGHWLPRRNRWMATSVSRELLLGIAMLAQRAYGAVASIYPGRPAGQTTIEGRVVNTKQEWTLSFDVPDPERYKGKPFILDDGAWKKVRSVEPAGEVETWNLRIAEDESYTAEGCIVKNCPLQFDIVDRLIDCYSNPGDLVFDPFAGLGTVPYRAILKGRRGAGSELNGGSFLDAVHYCRAAEEKLAVPTMFDLEGCGPLVEDDAAGPPPPDKSELAEAS